MFERLKSKARVSGFFYGGSAASWSSVINCTGVGRGLAALAITVTDKTLAKTNHLKRWFVFITS